MYTIDNRFGIINENIIIYNCIQISTWCQCSDTYRLSFGILDKKQFMKGMYIIKSIELWTDYGM